MDIKKIIPMCLVVIAMPLLSSCNEDVEVSLQTNGGNGSDCKTFISIENVGDDILDSIDLELSLKKESADNVIIGYHRASHILSGDSTKIKTNIYSGVCFDPEILNMYELKVRQCDYGNRTCKDSVKISR
ncbi:MAG: hypothetical protein OFPII_43330 [Osedax symbiont Rs1]|nr:MAG: hypothetical protein OFPII_43330 [Osedax symbiont Rs1]